MSNDGADVGKEFFTKLGSLLDIAKGVGIHHPDNRIFSSTHC